MLRKKPYRRACGNWVTGLAAEAIAKALLVYVEPTPYILGLVDRLTMAWPAGIDVIFLGENLSQPWHLPLKDRGYEVLPHARGPAVRRLIHCIRNGGYKIIHLAGWGHPLLLLAMLASRMLGMPVAVETDTPLAPRLSWQKRMAKRILYPPMLRIPSVFLPGGTRQKRYLQHYGVPENRIVIAQMTVDVAAIMNTLKATAPETRRAQRLLMRAAHDDCIFLFVGRLDPVKGIATLLEAFSQASGRSGKVRLLIVGDGTLRGMVQIAAARSERVRWAGRLSGEALLDAYLAADVLVLPSVFDTWGLVVNEAMAAGLPVIVSERVGCVDDLVIDGETGFVIKADRPSMLADAMTRLASDVPLRRAMGLAGRRRISSWTIEAEAEIVAGAWRKALPT
jgi:glycosyltransferase involved in cell wall biosynthesis